MGVNSYLALHTASSTIMCGFCNSNGQTPILVDNYVLPINTPKHYRFFSEFIFYVIHSLIFLGALRYTLEFRIVHIARSSRPEESSFNFIKKRLWHRCFPVNFDKFLRTPILQNISGRLFLFFYFQRED